MQPNSPAVCLTTIREQVNSSLQEFIASRSGLITPISPEVAALTEHVQALTEGGKRLRAAFAYVGYLGAGGQPGDNIAQAAAALELVQACALIHDDIMDASDMRRGAPSAHRRFEAVHRDAGWSADAESFGIGAAILAGDLCLSWADELLMSSEFPASHLRAGKQVYDIMRAELMAGQYLDLVEQARADGDITRARTVMRYKTAKYTIERPLHLGGALAGASEQLMTAYSDYGLALGEAFQLRDDVLGVFGTPEVTGKPSGDDLRTGKQTLLVAYTVKDADSSSAHRFLELLGNPELDEEDLQWMQELIIDSGALDEVESAIAMQMEHALAALERVPEPASGALHELAVAATQRHS
jgi:geranylgeranyl diphosphate synthase type I